MLVSQLQISSSCWGGPYSTPRPSLSRCCPDSTVLPRRLSLEGLVILILVGPISYALRESLAQWLFVGSVSNEARSLQVFGVSMGISRKSRGDKGQLAELAEFAAAIRGNDYPIKGADARAGFLATWMALAAYQSARSGAASQLPD